MFIGGLGADIIGFLIQNMQGVSTTAPSPISGIFVAILVGLIIKNTIGVHSIFTPGLQFSVKFLLKLGIVLIGLRLSFMEIMNVGGWVLPIVLSCILIGLVFTMWLSHLLKQSLRLGSLIAVGTGICGITAILATSPSIKSNDEETSYAIANITIFGLISMFFYPFLSFYLFNNDPVLVGIFLGTALHDTSQVTGAALMYTQYFEQEVVLEVATITKLIRNVLIVVFVPLISYFYLRKSNSSSKSFGTWKSIFPIFVLWFVLMSLVRTTGDLTFINYGRAFFLFNENTWENLWNSISNFGAQTLLGTALASIGLLTNMKIFKGLGFKPFYIGMAAALIVGVTSYIFVLVLGSFINY